MARATSPSLPIPGSPARTVTYTYDSADRLATVTDWAARVTHFRYDAATSQLSRIELPNGTQRVFTYDSAGRVANVRDEVVANGLLVSGFTLGYDALDRIIEETTLPEPAQFAVTAASMTYDDDDRLTAWNALTTESDADGNLTNGPLGGALATFAYDARNRLTSVGTTSYTYDAEGRRISRTASGTKTTFVHDPNAALSRLLQATTGGTTTRYVYAGSLLLYAETGSALRVHHYDYRGSTVALTDGTGAVLGRVTYGSYGEIVARTGDTATEFLYNGRDGVVTDPNGLYHMRARYYSPETRRFLNADPIGFTGGTNWYAYVGGSPVMSVDPIGLCAQGREGFWSSIWNAYGDSQMMQAQYGMAQINHDVQIWGNRSEAFGLGGALALYGTGIGTVTEGYIGWSVGEGCDLNIWERGISIVGGELQGVSLYMGGRSLYSNFAAESAPALSNQALRGIRSLEKQIAAHEAKLAEFIKNPTVRPGMDGQSQAVIKAAQDARIRHLQREIDAFKGNIEKLKNGGG